MRMLYQVFGFWFLVRTHKGAWFARFTLVKEPTTNEGQQQSLRQELNARIYRSEIEVESATFGDPTSAQSREWFLNDNIPKTT